MRGPEGKGQSTHSPWSSNGCFSLVVLEHQAGKVLDLPPEALLFHVRRLLLPCMWLSKPADCAGTTEAGQEADISTLSSVITFFPGYCKVVFFNCFVQDKFRSSGERMPVLPLGGCFTPLDSLLSRTLPPVFLHLDF